MQDRYAGDVGDFGKLGLLMAISAAGLRVGVNWYLVDDGGPAGDGRHITSNEKPYARCDPALAGALSHIAHTERCVHRLETLPQLAGMAFYAERLPTMGGTARAAWHAHGLRRLTDCDVVFLDPDNGLIPPSVGVTGRTSAKIRTGRRNRRLSGGRTERLML